MRIKQTDVTKREEYMRELIATDPSMSASRLNAHFVARFGNKLRTKRIAELKNAMGYQANGQPLKEEDRLRLAAEAQEKAAKAPAESELTVAARAPQRVRPTRTSFAPGLFPLVVKAEPKESATAFGARVLAALREGGASQLNASALNERFLVIEPGE